MAADRLRARLDVGVPPELAVGRGNSLFVYGSCWHPTREIAGLEVGIEANAAAADEYAMPRRDVYYSEVRRRVRELSPDAPWMQPDIPLTGGLRLPDADDPAYASGFWAFPRIPPLAAPETVELKVRATFRDGGAEESLLRRLTVSPTLPYAPVETRAQSAAGDEPLVAICMATFNPDPEHLFGQLESIRAQTHRNWVCVISDDDSGEDAIRGLARLIDGDPRFVLAPGNRRLGFYRNFERALALAPTDAEFVALADQDDRWDPDKLETLVAAIGSKQLAYSDMRVTAEDGTVLSPTFWDHRPNNHTDIDRLLILNTVTGAASLFRRELLDFALPFPPRLGPHMFHDQWLAATALATGEIAFVDRALYDYVQHERSVIGHPAGGDEHRPDLRERLGMFLFGQRITYFGEVSRLRLTAQVLLQRCAEVIAPDRRAALERVIEIGRPRSALRFGARALVPRTRSSSYGQERKLLRAVSWPVAVRLLSRTRRGRGWWDASMPDTIRAGFDPPLEPPPGIAELRTKTEALDLKVSASERPRINILIPGFDLRGLFAGYIGIFNLARRLRRDLGQVRLVCFELGLDGLPSGWRKEIERYSGLAGLFDEVEVVATPDTGGELAVSPADRFVATTWWSAHVAAAAVRELERERFLYLVQDYEPLFYPRGTWYALAEQSYSFPHVALFSTELLREYFRDRALGVYAGGAESGDRASVSFRNAITPVQTPDAADLARRERRRLLFYARLESYSPRNLFDLGILALSDLVAEGVFDERWDFYGIGSVGGPARFDLGHGRELEVMPRLDEGSYASVLRKHDLGLSLMLSPHPSLVPLEMASAGLVTVTNTYANKTPEAMAQISDNLIAASPTREGIREALRRAVPATEDFERRAAGGNVNWNTDWESALDDAVMGRIEALLDAC